MQAFVTFSIPAAIAGQHFSPKILLSMDTYPIDICPLINKGQLTTDH
jgi:hypothetical protein